jgi:hypothetical protein
MTPPTRSVYTPVRIWRNLDHGYSGLDLSSRRRSSGNYGSTGWQANVRPAEPKTSLQRTSNQNHAASPDASFKGFVRADSADRQTVQYDQVQGSSWPSTLHFSTAVNMV